MSIAEKLTTIAENEQKVFESGLEQGKEISYNIGYEEGHEVGYREGYNGGQEAGKNAEWNALWDAFQQNGYKKDYTNAFSSRDGLAPTVWNKQTFKPKYNINATDKAHRMFDRSNTLEIDLAEWLDDLGIKLNTKGATDVSYAFYGTRFTRLPFVDMSSATNTAYMFNNNIMCTKIDKILCSAKTKWHSTTFLFPNLVDCIFEGVIDNTDFSLSSCKKLNHESLMSVINCLADYTGTTTTRTATLGATNLGKLSNEEIALATEKGWTLA